MSPPRPPRPPGVRPAAAIALAAIVALALALRLANLGALGLVTDEGHQALAVEGILTHGIPLVPSGNIYLRGAPFLYAEAAAAAALGGVRELTLRLPAAVFGSLSVIAVFLLGRRLFGTGTGLLAAGLLAVSVWGLELARYARMYTLLQLCYVMAVYAFVRGYIDDARGWRALAIMWMLLAIITHQLGVMILSLFLIPAFLPTAALPARWRGNRRYGLLVPPAALGLVWMLFHREVEHLMVRTATGVAGGGAAEPGAGAAGLAGLGGVGRMLALVGGYVRMPQRTMPLDLLGSDPAAVAIAAAIALAGAAVVVAVGWRQPGRRLRALWALAILGAATMNLFAVVAGLVVLVVVLFPGGARDLRRPPLAVACAGALAMAVYWGVYLRLHPAALDPGWGEPWSIWRVFTGFPPVKSWVLDWFVLGWPRFTIVVAIGMVVMVAMFVADRRRVNGLVAVAAAVLPLVLVCFGRGAFNEVRYHFHVYPLLLVIFAAGVLALARALGAALDIALALARRPLIWRGPVEALLMVVLALGLADDAAPGDIALVLRRGYTTHKDPARATINWSPYATFHQDHADPARYVREHALAGDRIMVFGPTYWASIYYYYLGHVDYMISEAATLMHGEYVVHHVTGVRCITSVEELDQVLAAERDHRIWLLGDRYLLTDASHHFSPAMQERLRALSTPWQHLGRDGDTLVRRLDPPAMASPSLVGELEATR